ncbi:DUF5701 family protein [Streptomyces sp. SHP 1-2]|uniref:DUF5701 family protein n=1 Tax=Streptomyces sp. SHP 1-2 TaxID=2769489 RepID=UPI002237FBE3|nr:DUF5701 family protein [Streptomyces sp. SHP 1-2]MCW5249627.1 hypothetical protein [Streptomyces sp. SHP 1-2]
MPGTASAAPVLLPSLDAQAERLIEEGVHEIAGLSATEIRAFAAAAGPLVEDAGALLAVHPDRAPASALAPLLRRGTKPGFVVADMADVDRFAPHAAELPDAPLYLVTGPDRGDDLANWSPEEALPEIAGRGHTPLVLTEGIHWVLQRPEVLERNHCFMTIGSRLVKPNGALDARTPALWISNGTGRDGRERRDAPKVGWCWWGNRHTWLGFASATARSGLGA